MGMTIRDGKGSGREAEVCILNRLHTDSVVFSAISAISRTEGEAYVWTATADWGADKNVLWLRNDSTVKVLHVERITASVAATAVVEIWVGTGNAVAGTAVVGTCMNRSINNVAQATCRHTNTGVDAGAGMTLLSCYQMPATNVHDINLDGTLILGYLGEVAINIVTDVASSSFNIHGWFDAKEHL
jgi:hypothetical protein